MSFADGLIPPISRIIDRVLPDQQARNAAKLELLKLEGTQELEALRARLSPIMAEAQSADPWTSRARPAFLYVIYVLILWSIPMGILSAFRPQMAEAIGHGMNSYLGGIPESLYALFGTGYLGYTAARTWGKVKGVDK